MGLFENRLQLESTVVFLKCFIIIFPYFPPTWPENWGQKPWTTEWTGHTSDEKLGGRSPFHERKCWPLRVCGKPQVSKLGGNTLDFFLGDISPKPRIWWCFWWNLRSRKIKRWVTHRRKKLKSLHPHQKQSGHRKNYSSTVDHHGILIVGGWGASCTENLGSNSAK